MFVEEQTADYQEMSQVIKDSAIKLFGQTIPLPLPPDHKLVSDVSLSEQRPTSVSQDSKDESGEDSTGIIHEYESTNPREEKSTSSEISDDRNSGNKKDDQKSTALKKPDKIIPCPRCSSMDTKFCYYNNYNVNQPRHFCKNCQRYWTSGGTMRNVPVGSGRRKTKSTLLQHHPHMVLPEALQASDAVHLSSLKPNAFLISPPGFPVSFYPATLYWGSAAPSHGPSMALASPADPMSSGSVLGKHSRGGKENLDGERSLLIPKTLRIHDPNEAAKSSIWSTLGIKNEKIGSLNGAGLFKALESKGDRRSNVDHRAMVLQANPAALCRSLNFHEAT